MPWPQSIDYNAAIQNPALCFADPELREGQVATDPLGLPRPHSGNMADVYQIQGAAGQSWAVKCFTREVHGLRERYQAISDHLEECQRAFMVDFHYLDEGIRIKGQWYPLVKMSWVEGFTLNEFVAKHLEKPAVLDRLAQMWVRLSQELSEADMAHGDLQHGNVLLVPGSKSASLSLRLVDYDGLFVPALADRPSGELGHPNYQHPQRFKESLYSAEMDRFSHLVIGTALNALALVEGPELWAKYNTQENLLFRGEDFHNPGSSKLFRRLWGVADADVHALVGHLALACLGALATTPLLKDLVVDGRVRPLSGLEMAQLRSLLGEPAARAAKPRQSPPPGGGGAASGTGKKEGSTARHKPLKESAAAASTPAAPAPKQESPPVQEPAMSEAPSALVPRPSANHRKICAENFETANQAVTKNNYDYAISTLQVCCKLDPANLIYRQTLRRTEKAKYPKRGHWLAWLISWPARAGVRRAVRARKYLKALELGEKVLMRNPWDVAVQSAMAEAAAAVGLLDVAIWILEQARQKALKNIALHRSLARLYEKRGNFTQAMKLWEQIHKLFPIDAEAMHKAKDLAASETIARGGYDGVTAPTNPNAPGVPEPVRRARPPAPPKSEPAAGSRPNAPRESEPIPAVTSNERLNREIAQARQRLHIDPTSTASYLQMAACFRQAGDLEEARKVLNEGLGPTGNAFDLSAELKDLEIETFRRNLAITEEKLRDKPDDAELRRMRASLRKEVNTGELELFRQKADRYPADLGHRFEMGVRLFVAGQTDEAIRELQAAKAEPRYRWKALYHLGQCFKARNNWRLAQRNFEEALQSLPGGETEVKKDLLFLLAQGHAESGDLARAVDLGSELANQDFTFRDIGRLLDEWQDRLQKTNVSG